MNKFHRTMDTPSNKKCTRIAVLGTITMLQGTLYLVLSVWAFLIIKCQFDMTSTNLGTIIYFIYFRNNACGEVVWTKVKPVVADLPNVTIVAERTEVIVFFYIVISFLWIFTSLLLIIGATRTTLSKSSFHCYFTPWAIVIMAGCLLDVIATAFHIYDICNTSTAENTFRYLDVRNTWSIIQSIEEYYKHFNYPSIIFACVSSRLVVIFLINVFGMLWAMKQAVKLIFCRDDQLEASRNTHQPVDHRKMVSRDPNQYYYVAAREFALQPSDPSRRTFEPLKSGDSPEIIPPNFYEASTNTNRRPKRVKLPRNSTNTSNISQSDVVTPQRRLDPSNTSQPAQNRYFGNSQGARLQIEAQPMQLDAPDRTSYVSEELRSQLPWSYFNAREDISSQRKTFAHVEDHEILPPVPVPDYTLHFPKKERYSIQDRAAQLQKATHPLNDHSAVTRW